MRQAAYGRKQKGVSSALAKQKLNFRFHNPNTTEVTAEYILKILMQSNQVKIEQAMQAEVATKGLSTD